MKKIERLRAVLAELQNDAAEQVEFYSEFDQPAKRRRAIVKADTLADVVSILDAFYPEIATCPDCLDS